MVIGHRWEYNYASRWYECVSLPLGGVESYQWCVGCCARVTNKEIYEAGFDTTDFRDIHLDMIARGKGFEPVEAGTFAAFKLSQHRESK